MTVSTSAPRPFNSSFVSGKKPREDAMTSETSTSRMPPIPAKPNPGITKNSTAIKMSPRANSRTSSHPEVPPKKRLQKNRLKQSNEVRPPTLIPGALNSITNAMSPIAISKKVANPVFRRKTKVSLHVRLITCIGSRTLSDLARSSRF